MSPDGVITEVFYLNLKISPLNICNELRPNRIHWVYFYFGYHQHKEFLYLCQAFLSMGFSRQEHWSGLPCPSPGCLPKPGIEPVTLPSPALGGGFFTTGAAREASLSLQSSPNLSGHQNKG